MGRSADAREGVTAFLEKRSPRFAMRPSADMPPFYPVGDERAVLALSSTALLCFISLCSCFSMGAFSPLLPEIGRAGALADWQLGVVAGALGFARMATAIPAGWLAGRYLGTTLCASPALMLAGTVLLAASSSFSVLVLGRLILGFAYTLGTVSGE
jgi:MFS family permease